MTVRIRGIYATALTALLDDVVQASPPIERRFDDSFPVEPADVTVETTDERQGVGLHGSAEAVEQVVSRLNAIGRDTLAWEATLSRGVVYAGKITETLGSGAVVDCGDGEGFLPYSKTARRVETGDRLRVQVDEPCPPWSDRRPGLDTDIRIYGTLATLVRGGTQSSNQPELADILPAEPPAGWGADWGRDADDADLDALGDALETATERATALDDAFDGAPDPADAAPHQYWPGETTRWLWFGRESRFQLDDWRRTKAATMVGHHRTKAATRSASTAVDFVENVCDDVGDSEDAFPFEAVTGQFGPREGDRLPIGHGKPDGRRIELGTGEVTSKTANGEVVVEREMSPGGTYDALGVKRQAGDVAVTKFKEGRWWYPTVYHGEEGEKRGTYVNICTPVEIFPDEVRYVDLHVDVIKHADGTVERVDDDELDEAVEAGYLSEKLAEKARDVASAVSNAL